MPLYIKTSIIISLNLVLFKVKYYTKMVKKEIRIYYRLFLLYRKNSCKNKVIMIY